MMKTGQDFIKDGSGSAIEGFNLRQSGYPYSQVFQYPHEQQDHRRHTGWDYASELILEGKIYHTLPFHGKSDGCSGVAFLYGDFWVCHSCARGDLYRDWWDVKVQKDGDAWCCVGKGFKNLQVSDNYAFGDTREAAIKNYEGLARMLEDV